MIISCDCPTLFVIDSASQNHIQKSPIIQGFLLDENAVSSILYDQANDRVYLGSYTKGIGIVKKTISLRLKLMVVETTMLNTP